MLGRRKVGNRKRRRLASDESSRVVFGKDGIVVEKKVGIDYLISRIGSKNPTSFQDFKIVRERTGVRGKAQFYFVVEQPFLESVDLGETRLSLTEPSTDE
jgi:hypothetical protein